MAVKRLLVPRSRLDEFVAAYRAAADRVLRLGDPLAEGVTIGPVVTADSARAGPGARRGRLSSAAPRRFVLGTVDAGADLSRGHYLRPTLVLGASADDPLVAEEQFGPTVPRAGLRLRSRRPSRSPTPATSAWPPPSGRPTRSAPSRWPRGWRRASRS